MKMLLVKGQRTDVYLNPTKVEMIRKAPYGRFPAKAVILTDDGREYYSTQERDELIKEWGLCINEI